MSKPMEIDSELPRLDVGEETNIDQKGKIGENPRPKKKQFDRELIKKHMELITDCINNFVQKIKVKCEDILRPHGDNLKEGIRGGVKLTRAQREWLLDPRTINFFKENEWTLEERCEAFRNQFPEAPRLAMGTMR